MLTRTYCLAGVRASCSGAVRVTSPVSHSLAEPASKLGHGKPWPPARREQIIKSDDSPAPSPRGVRLAGLHLCHVSLPVPTAL